MPPPPNDSELAFKDFQDELVEVFSELANLFGNPRSHGEVYGCLFVATDPLTMEDISARLNISIGSVSMGLRTLEELGAIERHPPVDGRAQSTYTAKLELRILIQGFIKRRLIPRLEASNVRLAAISGILDRLPEERRNESRYRLERVKKWHQRATAWLPVGEKLLMVGLKHSSE